MPKDVKKRIIIEVDDKGDLKRTKKKIDALNKSTNQASKGSMEYNRNMKGLSKQSSNSSKNFSKTAQGMQGVLVPAYAEIAARVFALSAAFMALSKAADYNILIQGQEAYARMTGKNMASIAKSVQVASKHMLDFKEASTSVALATTSGISSKQIVAMTKAAVDSSSALGRSVTDTMDRLTRGIVKAEPEILDEIGVIIRLDKVYKDYAEKLQTTTAELTEGEKATARYNAIMGQLEDKFGGISDTLDPNYFAALSATVLDIINKVASFGVSWLGGPLKFLTESKTLIVAIMALILKSIGGKIFPALTGLGAKLTEMPAKMAARNKILSASIKTLRAEIAGSAAEVDKFNKLVGRKGQRETKGMTDARSKSDIDKYSRLQKAALKRAQTSLGGDGRKRVKGGIYGGMNLKELGVVEKQVKKLDKIQTNWHNKQQIHIKKHVTVLKSLQLGYQNAKLGVAKFASQQVEILNMGVREGIRQIGTNWTEAGGKAHLSLNLMKAGVSGLTVAVRALGAAINFAFKIFMAVTIAWSVIKGIASLWMDFDKPFKKAAQAAGEMNAALKTSLDSLNERPENINFDGMAGNFNEALKNASFAANLADEIYNATSTAMKKINEDLAKMSWLDKLLDKVKGVLRMTTFKDELAESLVSSVTLGQEMGFTLPTGIQNIIADAEKNKELDKYNEVMKTQGGEDWLTDTRFSAAATSYKEARAALSSIETDWKKSIEELTQSQLITYLGETDKMFEQGAEATNTYNKNMIELGQTFNKVSKYSREYAESLISKTEYYDLAKTQQKLQNLLDKEDLTKSDKVLAAVEGGYLEVPDKEKLVTMLDQYKEASELYAKYQAGAHHGASDAQKKLFKENLDRIRAQINQYAGGMFTDTTTAATILGFNAIEAQETALKAQTDKLALDHESKALAIFGNYALERQSELKEEILKQEIKSMEDKIAAGHLDDAALANAEEQLRLKRLGLLEVGATALKQAEHEAKLEGRKLSIMERYIAMKKDLVRVSIKEDESGLSVALSPNVAASDALEAMKKGEISTFFNTYAEGLDKSLKLTRQMAEWTSIWAEASDELKNKVRAAQQVMLRSNAWGGQGLDAATIYKLGQSGSLATGATLHTQRSTDALMKDPLFERNRDLIKVALEVQKIRAKNIDDDLKLTEEKMYLETEYRKALQAYEDAAWEERAKMWADTMKAVADSFGNAITKSFQDLFDGKDTDLWTSIREGLGTSMKSAAASNIGGMAQKAVFGNQGFLANFMGGILDKDGSTKWRDALFPKTDVEMRREQLSIFKKWDDHGIKINTTKDTVASIFGGNDYSADFRFGQGSSKRGGGSGSVWAEGIHGIYEYLGEIGKWGRNLMQGSPHFWDDLLSIIFANGGIAPGGFRAFAKGGVVNQPTLGMVGEGKYNEAVVPLPDGKSIPVIGGGGNNVTVNVSVDAQGQSAATETTGSGARELGYMLSQAVQQELVHQQRPGGLLSAY